MSENAAQVTKDFNGYLDSGKMHITKGEVHGLSKDDADQMDALATLALAAYRLLTLSPTLRVDGVPISGGHERRFTPCETGRASYDPEDWHRCAVLFAYFVYRRRGRAKGPPKESGTPTQSTLSETERSLIALSHSQQAPDPRV